MRAAKPLLIAAYALVAAVSCSSGDDGEEGAEPVCDDHPLATQDCRDAGLVLADGTVTGIYCDARGADDGSWPEGCEELIRSPAQVTYCCPW